MKSKIITVAAFLAAPLFVFAKDPFAGFYAGKIEGAKFYPLEHSPEVYARIVRQDDGKYKFDLLSGVFVRSESHCSAEGLVAKDGKIELKDTKLITLNGSITPESISAEGVARGTKVKVSLKRIEVKSPTLGLEAPQGATVLFDGKDMSQWKQDFDGSPCAWKLEDGAMVSKPLDKNGKKVDGTIATKGKFGAFRMHLEFKIPATGPGNSGVYVGPYEIQVFNSFGKDGNWFDCGSIYRQHPPKVNASIEPEAWQTYDIEFRPAKFDGDRLISHPTFTVYHNGVRIHNDDPVYYATTLHPAHGAHYVHTLANWPIKLQDHWNPVAYRNIWIQNL